MRLDRLEVRQVLLAHPPGPAVRAARDADLEPDALLVVKAGLEHDVDLGKIVLRVPAQLGDRPAALGGLRPDLADQVRVGPAGEGALVGQTLVAQRRAVAQLAQRERLGRRRGGGDRERGEE
jgi:hypothetical protein